ncbi:HAMP domain-containing histidine kinase [Candidatus Gracilibacteria bacterium]|nr:HAMP domain-containing histidine kinase [Candidatus Gracilibacteria bacterium]
MISHLINTYIKDDEKKLAIKISMASFLILITILIAIIWSSYLYGYRGIERELKEEITMMNSAPGMRDMMMVGNILPGVQRDGLRRRSPREIIIFDTEKNIIKNDFLDIDTEHIETLFSIQEGENNITNINKHRYLIARKILNTNTVFLFRDLTQFHSFHLTLIIIALIGSIFGLIIIYLLARYLAHITIEPIREQSRELEAYSHNVAHELRTPLSVMRSNLELLRMKPETRFIDSTNEEILNMEHIIESLLFLAKPNKGNTQQEINLTKKTEEIIQKYNNNNTIEFIHDKKHVQKKSSEELYTRILCNLIENAIKYKSEGDIIVQLTKNNITISNTIDYNMSEVEQKNITKAFYQGDQSRNSTGYGLGLALVSKIIEISGWKMNITTKDKIFIVEIQF